MAVKKLNMQEHSPESGCNLTWDVLNRGMLIIAGGRRVVPSCMLTQYKAKLLGLPSRGELSAAQRMLQL